MGCPVLLVLDACHSGQVLYEMGSKDGEDLHNAAQALMEAKPEILPLTASLPDQKSYEDDKWKHGALSLALLEVLKGKQLCPPETGLKLKGTEHVISLSHVEDYAKRRVNELLKIEGRKQTVFLPNNPRLPWESIPITVRR